jgi:hypothetical protein
MMSKRKPKLTDPRPCWHASIVVEADENGIEWLRYSVPIEAVSRDRWFSAREQAVMALSALTGEPVSQDGVRLRWVEAGDE